MVVLNDDLELAPGALMLLAELCGDDGCASPTIEAPGDDAFAGGRLDARGFGRHEPGARDFLTGAALCIPRAAWERVGSFEERLFLYYEDVDWCLRARAAGFALRVSDDATARHGAGSSTGGGGGETWAYYSTRNRLWLLQRMRGRGTARREAANTSARALLRLREPIGRAQAARACATGPRAGWAGGPSPGEGGVRRGRLHAEPSRQRTRRTRAPRRAAGRGARGRDRGARRGGLRRPRQRRARRLAALRQDLAWYGDGLARAARRAGADVLHCPTFRAPLRRPGLPVVATVHDLAVLREPGWFPAWSRTYGRHLMPRAIRLADRVVCVSQATARDVSGLLGVPDARVRVVPNGIDAVFSEPAGAPARRRPLHPLRRDAGAAQEPRAPRGRGLDPARRGASANGSCWPARTAGVPSRCRRCERVVALGRVADSMLRDLYAHAGCVAYPSLWEGFGLVAGEALASRLPGRLPRTSRRCARSRAPTPSTAIRWPCRRSQLRCGARSTGPAPRLAAS